MNWIVTCKFVKWYATFYHEEVYIVYAFKQITTGNVIVLKL
jgi:hypothetical protein